MKILLAGYYGFGNLGDELILRNIITQLKTKDPRPLITVLSRTPATTSQEFAVSSINRRNIPSYFYHLLSSDLLIVGGGGLIQNRTSKKSLLYYLGLIGAARLFYKPVLLYAVGVESVQGRTSLWFIQKILASPWVTITVRDKESKILLRSFGLIHKSISITADPVFSMGDQRTQRPRYCDEKRSALIIPRLPCPREGWALFSVVAKYLKEQRDIRVHGVFFQPRVEEKQLLSLIRNSPLSEEDFIMGVRLEDLPSLVRSCEYVVSSRYHGLILSALAHLPFMGVGDMEKVGQFCREWGMPFLGWKSTPLEIHSALGTMCSAKPNPREQNLEQWREAAEKTSDYVS